MPVTPLQSTSNALQEKADIIGKLIQFILESPDAAKTAEPEIDRLSSEIQELHHKANTEMDSIRDKASHELVDIAANKVREFSAATISHSANTKKTEIEAASEAALVKISDEAQKASNALPTIIQDPPKPNLASDS